MHWETWVDLLRKVPPAYKDNLMVVTTVGLEVSVQAVLRMEEQYMAIQGRLAGTTDTGRIFFIPYDQINLLLVQKPMKASEVRVMYGEPPGEADRGEQPPPEPAPPAEAEDVERTQPLPEPPPPPLAPVFEEPARPLTPPRLSKAELLARIRSRSQFGDSSGPAGEQ